jgi:hypothetical protein
MSTERKGLTRARVTTGYQGRLSPLRGDSKQRTSLLSHRETHAVDTETLPETQTGPFCQVPSLSLTRRQHHH